MVSFIKNFVKLEVASGVLLMIAAFLGLITANSFFSEKYFRLTPLVTPIVNDGLMAVFFFLVGMEIKREFSSGELSTWKKALLPIIGALGGVVVPAAIYLMFNAGTQAANGWAIPAATDIAFSLGILALFGRRVPISLKIFLLALATIDDIAAIIIIAVYYTEQVDWQALAAAGVFLALIWKCAREEIDYPMPYIILGLLLWLAVHESGVHATVAGVALGMLIPSLLREKMIKTLHGWVAFAIIPLFAFVNSGVSLENLRLDALTASMPLGIMMGLSIGKPLGIMLTSFLLIYFGRAHLPQGASWLQLCAVSMIAGIGFTMSLFIGLLSFDKPQLHDAMRMGVIAGSLISAMIGSALLWITTRQKKLAVYEKQ